MWKKPRITFFYLCKIKSRLTRPEDDDGAEEGVFGARQFELVEDTARVLNVIVQLLEARKELPDLHALLVRVTKPPAKNNTNNIEADT